MFSTFKIKTGELFYVNGWPVVLREVEDGVAEVMTLNTPWESAAELKEIADAYSDTEARGSGGDRGQHQGESSEDQ